LKVSNAHLPLENYTIEEIRQNYKTKNLSKHDLFEYYLDRIEKHNSDLNTFITVRPREEIMADVERFEQPIPVAHKDIFSTQGMQTTAASNILRDYIPPYDATVVTRFKDSGFVSLGKLNCDAFAHGTTGENSDYGPTHNPYDLNHSPGGSSSGSAAAVAANLVPIATATDTGGSIRLPASFTNTVGLKPTYGRVSRYGVIAMTSSTDTISHITKTVHDSAYVLGLVAGYDPLDATSSNHPVDDYLAGIDAGVKGLRLGVPKEYVANLDRELRASFEGNLDILRKLGAEIVENITLPHTEYALNAYYIITPSEVSSNLARFDGIRFGHARGKFGAEAKRRIMIGTFCLSSGFYDAYYLKAQKVRTLIIQDFKKAFTQVDALIAPVSPGLPPLLGATEDPLQAYKMDVLTVPMNLAGVPSLAVPAGFKDNLPLGIQIIGDHFTEKMLYRVGYAFEQTTEHYKNMPNLN
jgi:aspartyl-tRNA(Asn)/glutamyl-tRNA(Gln) amidotransferase subunit A